MATATSFTIYNDESLNNLNANSISTANLSVGGNLVVTGSALVGGAGLSTLTFTVTFAAGDATAVSTEICPLGFIPLFASVSSTAFANANTRTFDDLGKTGSGDLDGIIDDASLVLTSDVLIAGANNVKVPCNGASAMGTAVANTAVPALEAGATLTITLDGALAAGETPTFTIQLVGAAQG